MAAPVNGVYAPPVITQIDERDPTGVSLAGLNYSNQNKNNFGFINRETIAEMGWTDLNNRFYMPDLMRFGQTDPIIEGQEHLSLYQYGWNNPVLNTDPNGDCRSCPQGADAAKVYVAGAVVNNKDGSWTWTGSEWRDNPTVSAVEPSMADRWSEGSFGQRVVYGFADGLYSMFGDRHLNGNTFDSYDDKIKTKLGGLMTLGGPLLSGESAAANVVDDAMNLVDDAAIGGQKLLPEAFNRFSKFERHFGKHSGEWGAITKDAYYKRALSLMEGEVGGDIAGFTNSAGYTFRMNFKTAEFGIMRPNGVIETFFRRLNNPSAYWAEQITKYGK